MNSTELDQLQKSLGLSLKVMSIDWEAYKRSYGFTYENALDEAADRRYFSWQHFRGVHDPQSCLLDEVGHVRGIIIRATGASVLTLPPLPALEYLCVCDNPQLTAFNMPGLFPLLQHVELSNNQLQSFALTETQPLLSYLNLRDNRLSQLILPAGLPELQTLDATNNALTALTLPGKLPALKYLSLSNNQLERIESESDFSHLIQLDLKKNQLKELPKGRYDKLETLYVSENPLQGFEEILVKGDDKGGNAKEIIAQLRAFATSGEQPNDRVKLIVVGNGRVGKTSLVRALRGEPYDPNEVYTHGIAISELNKQHFPQVKTDNLNLKVWDFGGQEVFYATHQFFMSEEAAYVYVWTDQAIASENRAKDKTPSPADDRWRPHQYWMDNIRMHGQESPIVVVKTHAIDAGQAFDDNLLQDYHIEDGVQIFDAEIAARFLAQIQKELTTSINKLPLLGSPTPVSFYRLIEKMEELRQAKQFELSYAEFSDHAQAIGIAGGDVKAALSYLHKIGEVIYLDDKEELKDKVFINPNELTRRVYQLIQANDDLRQKEGIFDEGYAAEKLGSDWKTLLALLEGFELIFRRSDGKYIAPQYLPKVAAASENAQNSVQMVEDALPVKFRMRYPSFMPDNVMVNVLSKYGPNAANNIVFRDCISFRDTGVALGCFLKSDEEAWTISVHIQEGKETDKLARVVYDKLVELSKKAEIQVAVEAEKWVKREVLTTAPAPDFLPLADGNGVVPANGFEFILETKDSEFQTTRGIGFSPTAVERKVIDIPKARGARIADKAISQIKPLNILFTGATPRHAGNINVGYETRFKDLIREFNQENTIKFTEETGLTQERFRNYLFTKDPHIIHFAGHGTTEGLVLQDKELDAKVLLDLITLMNNTQILLLNACNTLPMAKELAAYIPYVIGTPGPLADDDAINFARGFYTGIAGARSVEDSYAFGINSIQSAGSGGGSFPVLVKRISEDNSTTTGAFSPTASGTSLQPGTETTVSNSVSNTPQKVFLSYARPLTGAAQSLKTHLAVQEMNGNIQFWYDQEIRPGDIWDEAIRTNINESDIFILLLSADFWASAYINNVELPLIEARRQAGARVLCVMVSANDYEETQWSSLQASPRVDGRLVPVHEWTDREKAWQAVVRDLKQIIKST